MIGGFQAAFRGFQQLTHLTIFHLVVVAQGEHGALYFRQSGNGFLQLCLGLITIEIVVGHQGIGHTGLIIVGADKGHILLTAHKVEALVDGNARYPGNHLGIAMKRTKAVPRLDKGILQHIIGIFVGKDNASHLLIQLFAVLAHHHLKSPTLGIGIRKKFLDLLVAILVHLFSVYNRIEPISRLMAWS